MAADVADDPLVAFCREHLSTRWRGDVEFSREGFEQHVKLTLGDRFVTVEFDLLDALLLGQGQGVNAWLTMRLDHAMSQLLLAGRQSSLERLRRAGMRPSIGEN